MLSHKSNNADSEKGSTPENPHFQREIELPVESLSEDGLSLLGPIDYIALKRFALILIDIARNPLSNKENTTDS